MHPDNRYDALAGELLVGPAARPGVHLIDVDSFQLPGFPCALFTERFLDPLRCDGHEQLVPVRPPTRDSDWYAFAVMAMRCAALVGPYGGVHKPRDPKDRVPSSRRPLRVSRSGSENTPGCPTPRTVST